MATTAPVSDGSVSQISDPSSEISNASAEPMVAAGWMGMAVKGDGAAFASGAITDAFIRARTLSETGVTYTEGWLLLTTTTVKVFIDVFIGIWSFVLSLVWMYSINKQQGQTVSPSEIWDRFPKFVLKCRGAGNRAAPPGDRARR